MTMGFELPADRKMSVLERQNSMAERYGEVVKFTEASRILGVNIGTVKHMLEDGRLSYACAGTRVDVRSIAAYIMAPRECNLAAKARKKGATCRL